MERIRAARLLSLAIVAMPLLLVWPAHAGASPERPLWTQVNELLCTGVARYECLAGGKVSCDKSESTAIWKVSFDREEVVYQTIKHSEGIVGRTHRFYGGPSAHNVLLLSSGRIMTFYERAQPDGTITHDAFVMGTTRRGDQDIRSDVTHYECTAVR